ncbi:hypothetical protein [Marinovum sp. B10]
MIPRSRRTWPACGLLLLPLSTSASGRAGSPDQSNQTRRSIT